MSQRIKSILKHKTVKRGTAIAAAVMMLILITGTLAACQAAAGSNPSSFPSAVQSPSPSAKESFSASADNTDKDKILEVAKVWAEAVKNRDGKAQYALYTTNLQKNLLDVYEGLNWVTGTSSPWVESYTAELTESGATVTFVYVASTGPADKYDVQLNFASEGSAFKISGMTNLELILGDISAMSEVSASPAPEFSFLTSLLGMTENELLSAIGETPVGVDEGGLGFDKTGIRVWFDEETHTKVAQVLIMSERIDIAGLNVGGNYSDFKAKLGEPVSDQNGDAHFKYGDIYLSVVRDTSTDQVIAVYILAEDF